MFSISMIAAEVSSNSFNLVTSYTDILVGHLVISTHPLAESRRGYALDDLERPGKRPFIQHDALRSSLRISQAPAHDSAQQAIKMLVKAMIHISFSLKVKRASRPCARLLLHLRSLLSNSVFGYTMDLEQALSSLQEEPHNDFGILAIPKRLRYSVFQPFYFGPWSKIVFGIGCAFSQCSIINVIRF